MARPLAKLLPVLIAFMACAEAPRVSSHRFPIGIYGVGRPTSLRELRKAGFDSFVTYNQDPAVLGLLAAEAKTIGMRMLADPARLVQSPTLVEDWPVDAWYLHDEPDVDETPADTLSAASSRIRAWDTRHFQTLVVGAGASAQTYGRIGDIFMLDWYPVPHLAIDSVADQIDEAYQYLPKSKPLWMVLQAFDWKDYPQRKQKEPRIGRFPDAAEIRFMSYLSVVHGARGIFYFTLTRPDGGALNDSPEHWRAVTQVVGELRALQPVLEEGKPAPLPFPLTANGPEARAWRYRGRDYLILINRKKDMLEKFPDSLLGGNWRMLFEIRRDPRDILTQTNGAYYLPPYSVMVLERSWF